MKDLTKEAQKVSMALKSKYDADEVDKAAEIYLEILNGSKKTLKSGNEEILKEFDSKDPIKYDFALFGYGVNRAADLQK